MKTNKVTWRFQGKNMVICPECNNDWMLKEDCKKCNGKGVIEDGIERRNYKS